MENKILYRIRKDVIKIVLSTLFGLLAIIGSMSDFISLFYKNETKQNDVQVKVEQLQTMSKNLDELKIFLESQKSRIENEQKFIQNLEVKKKNLEPLVNADKATFDAIFTAYEERQKANVWFDRILGLLFGVGGSILASFIYEKIKSNKT